MRAAVLHGREDLRIEEDGDRELGFSEVRVRISVALTCGTDLKVYRRGYHARMLNPPCRFGHEFAGTIIEVGSGVTDWHEGDRVVAGNSAPCGECAWCEGGQENLCRDLLFLNGAYAESIIIPERIVQKNLLHIPKECSFEAAALTEPLSCVVLGIRDLMLVPNERLLVIGSGPIGLMATALAREWGVHVTLAGRGEERLETARRLGAEVVDVGKSGNVEMALEGKLGERGGWDAVFEAVGRPETWEASIAHVRDGGRVNWFGGCPARTEIHLDTGRIHYAALTLKAGFHHTPETLRTALEILSQGGLRSQDFVTGRASLDDVPELFASMNRESRAVKTCILPE